MKYVWFFAVAFSLVQIWLGGFYHLWYTDFPESPYDWFFAVAGTPVLLFVGVGLYMALRLWWQKLRNGEDLESL